MNYKIRSLYIRVLRGKFDYNKKYKSKFFADMGAGKISTSAFKLFHSQRDFPVLRDIAKEIYWFEYFKDFKYRLFNDRAAPEEMLAAINSYSSRMPECYKWAKEYLVNENKGMEKGG